MGGGIRKKDNLFKGSPHRKFTNIVIETRLALSIFQAAIWKLNFVSTKLQKTKRKILSSFYSLINLLVRLRYQCKAMFKVPGKDHWENDASEEKNSWPYKCCNHT